ncbi:ANTAR domain-containing protein [Blastococcus sp. CT_GayMR19]|nr:ANTAR domain-containing protein [Blastococcus sp. CT_GayMR19]
MLRVDGAGLSLLDGTGRRVPLGASSEQASTAERLQFTTGEGPCTTAQETRQPVFAIEEDLMRRWPAFADLLLGATPFRAVVALPLLPALPGDGAMDLFFIRPDEVTDLDIFEAMAVGELVTTTLSDAAVWSTWSPDAGPEWLHGPVPRRRAAVWTAIATLGVDLDLTAPAALALMRAQAYGSGRSVDDVAADLLAGRLRPDQLRDPDT